jgi:hypothetical protein
MAERVSKIVHPRPTTIIFAAQSVVVCIGTQIATFGVSADKSLSP